MPVAAEHGPGPGLRLQVASRHWQAWRLLSPDSDSPRLSQAHMRRRSPARGPAASLSLPVRNLMTLPLSASKLRTRKGHGCKLEARKEMVWSSALQCSLSRSAASSHLIFATCDCFLIASLRQGPEGEGPARRRAQSPFSSCSVRPEIRYKKTRSWFNLD